jgi:hypothetical protein
MNNIKHSDFVITEDGRDAVVIGMSVRHPGMVLVRYLRTDDTALAGIETLHGPVGFCGSCKHAELHTKDCDKVAPAALAMLGREALVIKMKS